MDGKAATAAMWGAFAVGAALVGFLLTRAELWTDPFFTPILGLGVAWLVAVPMLLVWYQRHGAASAARRASADPVERARARWERELYWWVGEGPLFSSVVGAGFTVAALLVSAIAGLAQGRLPPTLALTPLIAVVAAFGIAIPAGLLRIRWLRRRLAAASADGLPTRA